MSRKRLLLFLTAGVIVVLLAVVGVLSWKVYQNSKNGDGKKTSSRIVSEVGAIYMLPTNEEPTVALVQDKTKLGDQEFFKNAQNGDYLLVYQKEKIALIYRETSRKLVNVGPVNIGGQAAGAETH